MNTLSVIEGTDFSLREEENRYYIYRGENPLTSPGGKTISTQYKELAQAFADDLKENGYTLNNPDSILCWHYDLLDRFIEMTPKEILYTIMAGIMNTSERDWTFKCPYMDESAVKEWEEVFGTAKEIEDRLQIVADWLNACTRMQITAAHAISEAFGSFNVAYVLAYALEHGNISPERIAEMVVKYRPGNTMESVLKKFDMFKLYYGFHMDGSMITEPITAEADISDEQAEELIKEFMNRK